MIRGILSLFACDDQIFNIKDVIWWQFFLKQGENYSEALAFLAIYVLCKSDTATCNLLSLDHINDFQTIGYGGHIVFQNHDNYECEKK